MDKPILNTNARKSPSNNLNTLLKIIPNTVPNQQLQTLNPTTAPTISKTNSTNNYNNIIPPKFQATSSEISSIQNPNATPNTVPYRNSPSSGFTFFLLHDCVACELCTNYLFDCSRQSFGQHSQVSLMIIHWNFDPWRLSIWLKSWLKLSCGLVCM